MLSIGGESEMHALPGKIQTRVIFKQMPSRFSFLLLLYLKCMGALPACMSVLHVCMYVCVPCVHV